MLWLKNRGFSCAGLDFSPALAELARRHTGLWVIEADFEAFDFHGMDMDALLLIGALVHVPHERFQLIFSRILRAMKPQGHVLLTMKQGRAHRTDRMDGSFTCGQRHKKLEMKNKRKGLTCYCLSRTGFKIPKKFFWKNIFCSLESAQISWIEI